MLNINTSGTEGSESCLDDLGCWKDYNKPNRAISGGNRLPQFWNSYTYNSRDLVEDCRNYAESRGWTVFAAQFQTECFTSADAGSTYQKHGQATNCENGKGGANAMNVYMIVTVCPGTCIYAVRRVFI